MKRKLLRQISNEWRANTWLSLELLIVSVVLWYLVDLFYVNISVFNEPRGFNTENCYLINQRELSPKSPEYKEYENGGDERDDFQKLFEALRNRPDVEAVEAGYNAFFYNGSNSGGPVRHETLDIPNDGRYIVHRRVTADFPIVFRLRGSLGESSEELAKILHEKQRGCFLASANLLGDESRAGELRDHIGEVFDVSGDSLVLAGVYQTARYADFYPGYSSPSIIIPRAPRHTSNGELVVRVKEKMDDGHFDELLMKEADNYRFGNFYIASVKPFTEIRNNFQRNTVKGLTQMAIASLFLALNIFLGILGTFWFRTRQRMSEIALRMACGASRTSVFRRIVSEGEVLLLLVTPVAIVCDWLLTKYQMNTWHNGGYFVAPRFVACVVITWALVSLMIFLGSLFPARRAMHVAPAVALKDE